MEELTSKLMLVASVLVEPLVELLLGTKMDVDGGAVDEDAEGVGGEDDSESDDADGVNDDDDSAREEEEEEGMTDEVIGVYDNDGDDGVLEADVNDDFDELNDRTLVDRLLLVEERLVVNLTLDVLRSVVLLLVVRTVFEDGAVPDEKCVVLVEENKDQEIVDTSGILSVKRALLEFRNGKLYPDVDGAKEVTDAFDEAVGSVFVNVLMVELLDGNTVVTVMETMVVEFRNGASEETGGEP